MSEIVNEVKGCTRILMETCNFTWSIENFSVICSIKIKEEKKLNSPNFSTVETSPTKWCAEMDFYSNKNFIGLFLRRTSSDPCTHHVSYTMSIIGSDAKKYCRHSNLGIMFHNNDSAWGYPQFIERKILLEDKPLLLLPNNTLTVMFELKVSKSDDIDETTHSASTGDDSDSLIGDLQHLYENKMFSDFSVKVGEEKLKVHKNILCARSSVFNSMFKSGMKENITNCLEITDFDPPVVKAMLRHIYCGQVENLTFESSIPLFSIADKYNLQDLKNMCRKYLLKNLNVDNICTVLVLAEMHNDQELMKAAKIMFCVNAAAIQETEPWIDLSKTRPHLAFSMYHLAISKKRKHNSCETP